MVLGAIQRQIWHHLSNPFVMRSTEMSQCTWCVMVREFIPPDCLWPDLGTMMAKQMTLESMTCTISKYQVSRGINATVRDGHNQQCILRAAGCPGASLLAYDRYTLLINNHLHLSMTSLASDEFEAYLRCFPALLK